MKEREKPDILYQDNHVLVVKKPAGMLSQSDQSRHLDLLTYCKEYIKTNEKKPGNVYLALVHRLDRNTEGIMVFGKTSKAAARLSKSFACQQTTKQYRALIQGSVPDVDQWTDYIKKDAKNKIARAVNPETSEKAKRAELAFRKVAQFSTDMLQRKLTEENLLQTIKRSRQNVHPQITAEIARPEILSLVSIELFSGRFHQIRFQFSSRGFPVTGDVKYGSTFLFTDRRLFLSACQLSFEHPVKKETMQFTIEPAFMKYLE